MSFRTSSYAPLRPEESLKASTGSTASVVAIPAPATPATVKHRQAACFCRSTPITDTVRTNTIFGEPVSREAGIHLCEQDLLKISLWTSLLSQSVSIRARHSPSGLSPGCFDPYKISHDNVYGIDHYVPRFGTIRDRYARIPLHDGLAGCLMQKITIGAARNAATGQLRMEFVSGMLASRRIGFVLTHSFEAAVCLSPKTPT